MKIILTCEFSSESYTHASVGLEFRIFWCTITVAFAPSIYYHGDGFVHKFLYSVTVLGMRVNLKIRNIIHVHFF